MKRLTLIAALSASALLAACGGGTSEQQLDDARYYSDNNALWNANQFKLTYADGSYATWKATMHGDHAQISTCAQGSGWEQGELNDPTGKEPRLAIVCSTDSAKLGCMSFSDFDATYGFSTTRTCRQGVPPPSSLIGS